jgi:signal transduction histidine kinase
VRALTGRARSLAAWLRRLPPQLVDGLIALAMLVEIELEAWLDTVVPANHRLGASFAAVLLVAPVMVRRRWPAGALVACAAVAGVLEGPPAGNVFNGMTGVILPVVLLAFNAGARLDLRRGLTAAVAAAALIATGALWATAGPSPGYSLGSELVSAIALPLPFWLFGRMWRERNRRLAAFGELVARLDRERERQERMAGAEERMRIGRELHDIIAQNVSAIIIQAGGARQLIDADRGRATEAILAVERAGREALADLRRALGLLRDDDDPRELAPRPGLARLGALLDAARGRGLDCALGTVGEPAGLTTGVDLLGYRLIEAALLAPDGDRRPTDVTVDYGQGRLEIEIRGRGSVAGLDRQLHDVSERIALYDGRLTIRAVNANSFAIIARLPREAPAR